MKWYLQRYPEGGHKKSSYTCKVGAEVIASLVVRCRRYNPIRCWIWTDKILTLCWAKHLLSALK